MTSEEKIKACADAYSRWRSAEVNFGLWWNPSRRLSEDPPRGADSAKKCVEFSRKFKEVFGVVPPNGFGQMTLRQMARIAEEWKVR